MKFKFQKEIVFSLFFFLTIFFAFALTSVTVISPLTGQNVSGSIVLNATTDEATVNVTFSWKDSNGNLVLNTTIYNDTLTDIVFENSSFDTTLLTDGLYDLIVNATNASGTIVGDNSVTSIRIDNTAPIVTLVNSSFNTTDTTPTIVFNYTDALFSTASCTLYLNDSAYNTSTINNATNTDFTVNSTLTDGSYSAKVNCTDGSNNEGTSTAINILVDTGVPAVTTFNSPASGSYNNVDFVLNVTVTGSPATVMYQIENGSNSSQVIVNYTNLSNPTGNFWNATINISALIDWNYTLRINATDTLGNSNSSETLGIGVDTADPTISAFSCDDLNQGATQSCSCSATDNSQSFGGTVSTSVSSASTTTVGTNTVTCTATDSAGNTVSSSTTYTVSSINGGGGNTGSAGGIAVGVKNQFEKKVWTSINAGETAEIVTQNGVIGVTKVKFTVDKTIWGPWIEVKKIDALPSTFNELEQKVYKFVQINKGASLQDNLINHATIEFKVTQLWLEENKFDSSEIILFRYVDDNWVPLKTNLLDSDEEFVYYLAETPGFSYFAIGQQANEIKIDESSTIKNDLEEVVLENDTELAPAEITTPEPEAKSFSVELILLLILLGLGVIFAIFWFTFNKK